MNELSMTVFALVVLLAIDFPTIFLYTKAKTAWASDCNLCLHNLKLSSFSEAVFFISTSAYFSNHYHNLNYLFDLREWSINKQFIDRLEIALAYAFQLKVQNLARLKSIIDTQSYLNTSNAASKSHKNLRGAVYYKGIEKC